MPLLSSFIDPVARHVRRFSQGVEPPSEARHGTNNPLTCDAPTRPPRASPDGNTEEEAPTSLGSISTPSNSASGDTLFGRFRRFSSFSFPPQDAVVEQDSDDPPTAPPTAPAPLTRHTSMPPDNPRIPIDQLRRLRVDAPLPSTPAASLIQSSRPTVASQHATARSESLPADDGMAHLRLRIHDIREMNITDQERARMIHGLMTERYNYMRPTSPSSFVSHDRPFTPNSGHSMFSDAQYSSPTSAASDVDLNNPYNLRLGDTSPTYRPKIHVEHSEEDDDETEDEEQVFGCQHYKRNVKVQCYECRRWYTCRHCHDAVEDHQLNRKQTRNMLCMACGMPQKASDHCENCQTEAACYYCDICKLWDNSSKKKIYHCPECGICRQGEGLGKDFYHCKVHLSFSLLNVANNQ